MKNIFRASLALAAIAALLILHTGPAPAQQRGPIYCQSTAKYDAAAAASLRLVTGISGNSIYICGYTLAAAAANNLSISTGTGTNCGTGTTVITPVWQFAAAGNLTIEGAFWKGLLVPPLTDVCITSSGAVASQAVIFYSQQ